MSNHFHLLLHAKDDTVGNIVKRLASYTCITSTGNTVVTDTSSWSVSVQSLVKTRATSPRKESTINEAIKGMQKDSVTREGLTLPYMKRQYRRDKQYSEAKVVERFEKAVNNPYHCDYNAIAIV